MSFKQWFFLLVGMLAIQGLATAEMVQGKVQKVDSSGKTVTVQTTDGQTREIKVTGTGASDMLNALEPGDQVTANATQKGNNWEASSIQLGSGSDMGSPYGMESSSGMGSTGSYGTGSTTGGTSDTGTAGSSSESAGSTGSSGGSSSMYNTGGGQGGYGTSGGYGGSSGGGGM